MFQRKEEKLWWLRTVLLFWKTYDAQAMIIYFFLRNRHFGKCGSAVAVRGTLRGGIGGMTKFSGRV